MVTPKFWRECIEHGLDPLWAYRYLRWRLGHPRHADWKLLDGIPGPALCIKEALSYIKEEVMDDAEGEEKVKNY